MTGLEWVIVGLVAILSIRMLHFIVPSRETSEPNRDQATLYFTDLSLDGVQSYLVLAQTKRKWTAQRFSTTDCVFAFSNRWWFKFVNDLPTLVDRNKSISSIRDISLHVHNTTTNGSVDDVTRKWIECLTAWDAELFIQGILVAPLAVLARAFYRLQLFCVKQLLGKQSMQYNDVAIQSLNRYKQSIEKKLTDALSPKSIRHNQRQLTSILNMAEVSLRSVKFLAGNHETVVDSLFVPIVALLKGLNLDTFTLRDRPAVSLYWNRMQGRNSLVKMLAHRGVFSWQCAIFGQLVGLATVVMK